MIQNNIFFPNVYPQYTQEYRAYTIERSLGRGSFGKVGLARLKTEEGIKEFAIKFSHVDFDGSLTNDCYEASIREEHFIRKLDYDHQENKGLIVKLHKGFNVYLSDNSADECPTTIQRWSVYERLNGTLHDLIYSCSGKFSLDRVRHFTIQLSSVLKWLGVNKIVHGDITPSNIGIRKLGKSIDICLIDFGFAFSTDEPPPNDQLLTTAYYRAPEIPLWTVLSSKESDCEQFKEAHKQFMTQAIDIWSVSCIVGGELYLGKRLISISNHHSLVDEQKELVNEQKELCQKISRLVGDFPEKIWKQSYLRMKEGMVRRPTNPKPQLPLKLLERAGKRCRLIETFIQQGLKIDPEERLKALLLSE